MYAAIAQFSHVVGASNPEAVGPSDDSFLRSQVIEAERFVLPNEKVAIATHESVTDRVIQISS
jgi:hypothetical protein